MKAIVGTYIAIFLGGQSDSTLTVLLVPSLLEFYTMPYKPVGFPRTGRLVGLNYQQLRMQADFRYSHAPRSFLHVLHTCAQHMIVALKCHSTPEANHAGVAAVLTRDKVWSTSGTMQRQLPSTGARSGSKERQVALEMWSL